MSTIAIFQQVLFILFGNGDGLLRTLVLFVVIDYITGVMVAVYQHELSSKIGFSGISKKIAIFIIISVSHAADQYLLESGEVLQTATTLFFFSNECISILENTSKLGVPLPPGVKKLINHLKSFLK